MKELELADPRMKTGIAARPSTGPSKKEGKVFGELFEITKAELVDFVEQEDPNILVFIHIYQIVRQKPSMKGTPASNLSPEVLTKLLSASLHW
jgi:hypothetical protein